MRVKPDAPGGLLILRSTRIVSLLGVVALTLGSAAWARADRLQASDGGSVGNKYLGGTWAAKAWIENGATANGFGTTADAQLKLLTKEFKGFQGKAKVIAARSRRVGEIVLFAKVANKTLVSERNTTYLEVSKSLPPLNLEAKFTVGVGPVRLSLDGDFQAEARASIRASAGLMVADGWATLQTAASGSPGTREMRTRVPDARPGPRARRYPFRGVHVRRRTRDRRGPPRCAPHRARAQLRVRQED